jgi:hypothetical protein
MAAYTIPKVGQMVRVRARRHVVERVAEPSPERPMDQHLVSLACVEDDSAGEQFDVLWEAEPDARVLSDRDGVLARVERFDPPARFAAWYYSVRWNSLSAADNKHVQAPFRAGISVESYQFVPLRMALDQPRVRLFIADDVGLGKTIEAALIVRELMLRQRVRRVVVAAPASVLTQWQDELETRFGLTFVVVDRDYLRARRRERGWQFNPWKTHPRFIISHALLRDPHYTAPLRELLLRDPAGSMLVLDEAHHAAPASGGRTARDSAFTRTLRDLAPLFEHRVFLSATPHNGHSNSFSALMEILDPTRFIRGLPVDPKARNAVMVRRLKSELRTVGVAFPERKVVRLAIQSLPADDPDLALPALLDEYCNLREDAVADESKEVQQLTFLSLTTLRKRLLSSVPAFKRTLAAHRAGLERRAVKATQLPLFIEAPGPDDERAGDDPEAIEQGMSDAVAAASAHVPFLSQAQQATALLDQLTRLAEAHEHRADARVCELVRWMRANLLADAPSPAWNNRRVIVFTEYVDTQRYLEAQLALAFKDVRQGPRFHDRIATLDGQPGNAEQRDALKRRFNADPAEEPLRILVCTDAAREGINLQSHCTDLFHFDLPWNPSRLEQRNGRIDRKGQPADTVRCHYFVYTQRLEDEVLDALVRKTETIRKDLGSLGDVLVGRTENLLRQGISRRRAAALAKAIDRLPLFSPRAEHDVDEGSELVSLPSLARLKADLGEAPASRDQLQQAKLDNDALQAAAEERMEFSTGSFRRALDVALGLLDAPPLARDAKGDELWHLAPLDGSPATLPIHRDLSKGRHIDASWAETLDGLRIPYGLEPGHDEQPYPPSDRWTWRRRSRLRPLRFRASAIAEESTVHMHLEHRVAQRLLGQLSAQTFTRGAMARATILATGSGIDRVVLLGRLVLFGPRGARLHDEIITRTAAWTGAAKERTAGLRPLDASTARDTIKDLQRALSQPSDDGVTEHDRKRRLESLPADVAELRVPLDKDALSRSEAITLQLKRLGATRAAELQALLAGQQAALDQNLADPRQLSLIDQKGFSELDRQALRSIVSGWRQRRGELSAEIESAPAAVEAEYTVKHTHFELLGVVYLTRGA